MANENESVYMDTVAVTGISVTLKKVSAACHIIVQLVNIVQQTLRATAFLGAIGNWAAANSLEPFKKNVRQLGEKMQEASDDVKSAVDMFVNGDTTGSRRFCG